MSDQTLKGKVLRPFYFGGKPLEKDKVVELPRIFALEMKAANKLAIIEPSPIEEGAKPAPAKEKAHAK